MNSENKTVKTIKKVAGLVLGCGAGIIVGNVVRTTTPPDINKIKNLAVGATSLVLGFMLGDKATEYAEKQIDDLADAVSTDGSEVKESTDEVIEVG